MTQSDLISTSKFLKFLEFPYVFGIYDLCQFNKYIMETSMNLTKIFSTKALLLALVAWMMASGAYAATFSVSSTPGSRDEVTGPGKTSGTLSASGKFRIKSVGSGTLKLSIMQMLNRRPSGGAEPITQLGLTKSGSKFAFYIVQGTQQCTSAPTIALNEYITISVTVEKGGSPAYTIGGVRCQKSNSAGDRAGKLVEDNGRVINNTEYYSKYGAYGSSSNRASATVEWINTSY